MLRFDPLITHSAMPAPSAFNRDRYPLLLVTTPAGPTSDEELGRFLQQIRTELAHGVPVVMVLDARRAQLCASQRAAVADASRRDARRYPDILRAVAIVHRSPLERAITTAIGWLVDPPYPVRTFSTLQEAVHWARAQLPATSERNATARPGGPKLQPA